MPKEGYKAKVCIGGGAGFIGSHLAKRLKADGYYVVCADWVKSEFMKNDDFCHEFKLLDLRNLENCIEAVSGCDHIYNLAADMGGMGFIVSNQSLLFYNNTMISSNMIEAARRVKCKRFFFSSSACVYNESTQMDPANPGLKEDMAWPARPQDTYGLEKLYAEEMSMVYGKDFGFEARNARFHNVYGPYGTWKGGREKSPAAFVRKAICSTTDFEMWGDGEQTRSYTYIDDCVEGVIRIMMSDCKVPLNLGTEEMISMNDFAKLAMKFDGRTLPIRHVKGPEGVRGRNSDNTMIKKALNGWEPSTTLEEGIRKTHAWIKTQVEADKQAGIDITQYATSHVVQQMTDELDTYGHAKKSLGTFAAIGAAVGAVAAVGAAVLVYSFGARR